MRRQGAANRVGATTAEVAVGGLPSRAGRVRALISASFSPPSRPPFAVPQVLSSVTSSPVSRDSAAGGAGRGLRFGERSLGPKRGEQRAARLCLRHGPSREREVHLPMETALGFQTVWPCRHHRPAVRVAQGSSGIHRQSGRWIAGSPSEARGGCAVVRALLGVRTGITTSQVVEEHPRPSRPPLAEHQALRPPGASAALSRPRWT